MDLAGNLEKIYGLQQVTGKILGTKELCPVWMSKNEGLFFRMSWGGSEVKERVQRNEMSFPFRKSWRLDRTSVSGG